MKNRVTILKLSFLLTFAFVSVSSFSQTLSFGGKAGYVTYHRTYAPSIQIEGTQIYKPVNSSSFRDGWRFAAFSQLNYERFSVRAEIAYTYNIGAGDLIVIDNWENPLNEKASDKWIIGAGNTFNNFEFNLSGGFKVFNWLTIWAGPGLWHQKVRNRQDLLLIDLASEEDPYNELKNLNKMRRFEYAIQESYVPLVLTGKLEIEAEFRKFLFSIAYDSSLSAVGKYLEYEGRQYFFRQTADRYVVSIGYILPTKYVSSNRK